MSKCMTHKEYEGLLEEIEALKGALAKERACVDYYASEPARAKKKGCCVTDVIAKQRQQERQGDK